MSPRPPVPPSGDASPAATQAATAVAGIVRAVETDANARIADADAEAAAATAAATEAAAAAATAEAAAAEAARQATLANTPDEELDPWEENVQTQLQNLAQSNLSLQESLTNLSSEIASLKAGPTTVVVNPEPEPGPLSILEPPPEPMGVVVVVNPSAPAAPIQSEPEKPLPKRRNWI